MTATAEALMGDEDAVILAAARIPPPVVLQISIPGEPVAKGRPRMTKQGRAYTPSRTVRAETWARAAMTQQVGQPMLKGPLDLDIIVTMPIPASWPRKRQEAARAGIERPAKKPDCDNFAKLYGDAGNGILWADDSQICGLSVAKIYGDRPGVLLTVRGEGWRQ